MSFSPIGLRGQGSSGSTTLNVAVTTAAIPVDSFVLLNIAINNVSTSDGDNSEVSSVTDDRGNSWTKYGEYTNSQGVTSDGATNSLWGTIVTTQLEIADHVTATFGASKQSRAGLIAFSIASGVTIVNDATPVTSEVTAANDFGSAAFSGLASQQRLYFRGMAKQTNATTTLTATSNFTSSGETGRSGSSATNAVINRAEYRINTSTGETSNPTLAASGDTASVFLALIEQAAGGGSPTLTATADALLKKAGIAKTATADARLMKSVLSVSFTADAQLKKLIAATLTADALLKGTALRLTTADAHIKKLGIANTATADAVLIDSATTQLTATADAILRKVGAACTATADAALKKLGVPKSVTADAILIVPSVDDAPGKPAWWF